MNIHCSLDSLETFFKQESLSCKVEKDTGEFPVSYLTIDMGLDGKNRPQKIQIIPLEKEIAGRTKDSLPNFLQIKYLLPFEFLLGAENDLARYLLLINKTLDFPGFGMSESDRKVYYRYDLHCRKSLIEEELLKGLIGNILLMIDSFIPTIEKIALRQISIEGLIENYIK